MTIRAFEVMEAGTARLGGPLVERGKEQEVEGRPWNIRRFANNLSKEKVVRKQRNAIISIRRGDNGYVTGREHFAKVLHERSLPAASLQVYSWCQSESEG